MDKPTDPLARQIEASLLLVARNVVKHLIKPGSWSKDDSCFQVDLREAQEQLTSQMQHELRLAEVRGMHDAMQLHADRPDCASWTDDLWKMMEERVKFCSKVRSTQDYDIEIAELKEHIEMLKEERMIDHKLLRHIHEEANLTEHTRKEIRQHDERFRRDHHPVQEDPGGIGGGHSHAPHTCEG